ALPAVELNVPDRDPIRTVIDLDLMAVEFLLRCGGSEHVDVHHSSSARGDGDGTADAPLDLDARRPLDLIMARKGVTEGVRGDEPYLLIGHGGQRTQPNAGPDQQGGQIRAQAIHDVIPRQDADRERASSWTGGAWGRLESVRSCPVVSAQTGSPRRTQLPRGLRIRAVRSDLA